MSAAEGGPPALLFTIGHSNHDFDRFLELLRRHGIAALADVRSRPYSRFVPHFSKERLERLLAEQAIDYLYLGAELGGKPKSAEAPASQLDYRSRVEQPDFRAGIDRLLAAAAARPMAMMCRERDPLDCHRLHLICRYLAPRGLDVRHILPDGTTEPQATTERRLLERDTAADLPLFRDCAEEDRAALERAYDAWWRRAG
jgi:uncharacterized protein (DUF488 family)